VHFFQEISQGAQAAHALSQGISQGAQHDQRVSALLVVGFGMPLSATRIVGAAAGGERLCANRGFIWQPLPEAPRKMLRGLIRERTQGRLSGQLK